MRYTGMKLLGVTVPHFSISIEMCLHGAIE